MANAQKETEAEGSPSSEEAGNVTDAEFSEEDGKDQNPSDAEEAKDGEENSKN